MILMPCRALYRKIKVKGRLPPTRYSGSQIQKTYLFLTHSHTQMDSMIPILVEADVSQAPVKRGRGRPVDEEKRAAKEAAEAEKRVQRAIKEAERTAKKMAEEAERAAKEAEREAKKAAKEAEAAAKAAAKEAKAAAKAAKVKAKATKAILNPEDTMDAESEPEPESDTEAMEIASLRAEVQRLQAQLAAIRGIVA